MSGVRFPPVSWSSDESVLPAIEAWRAAFVIWVGSGAISDALANVLLELLGERRTATFERYPYPLSRYPRIASVEGVMLWRAGVVDFLSDIWDTIGEADFTIEECRRVSELLTPSAGVCPLCLEAQGNGHFDHCPVQHAWRSAQRAH